MVDAGDRDAARVEPDLAARQAAIGAIGWLLLSVLLQLLAHARLLFPDVAESSAMLSYGRLRPIADNAFVFGWLAAVALCATFVIVPRAVGAQLHNEGLGAFCMVGWHLVLLAGLATLAVGMNQGRLLGEMPFGVDLAVLLLALLVFYDVAMTAVRRNEPRLYVSVWYLAAAALVFPIAWATGNMTALAGVQDALASAFYLGALEFLWLVPVTLGIAYYVIPASTAGTVPSRTVARIGFWTLMLVGGWTGLRFLVGGPIPDYLEATGVGMTVVALIPILSAAVNLVGAVRQRWDAVIHPGAVRYATTAVVVLVVWTVLAAVSAVPSVSRIVGLTSWHGGLRLLGWLGVFSFAGFALLSYAYPLLVGRSWFSDRASAFHYWATLTGTLTVVAGHLVAGIVQGASAYVASAAGAERGDESEQALEVFQRSLRWTILAGWLLVLVAQAVLAWNAARTSRSGDPVQLVYLAAPETVGSTA